MLESVELVTVAIVTILAIVITKKCHLVDLFYTNSSSNYQCK